MQITTAPGPVDRTSPFPTAPCQPLLPLSGYYSLDFLSYLSHNCSTHPLPAPEPTLPGRPLSLDSLLAYTTRQPGAALPAPSPAPPAAPSPQATDQDPDPIFTPLRSRTAHFEHLTIWSWFSRLASRLCSSTPNAPIRLPPRRRCLHVHGDPPTHDCFLSFLSFGSPSGHRYTHRAPQPAASPRLPLRLPSLELL